MCFNQSFLLLMFLSDFRDGHYIEAGADTELDPLFMGPEYLADWAGAVKKAAAASGVRVANLYSGHGTYTTLGLTHTDPRVRRRMIDRWFKPMIATAAQLGAGLGFFAHGFAHYILQDAALYNEAINVLEDGLAELNAYAASCGYGKLGIEQMYSPHQYPWTITQTEHLIRTVTEKSKHPFYFTEDLGHHQRKFQRPDDGKLKQMAGNIPPGTWLGTDKAFTLAEKSKEFLPELAAEIRNNPHLFAEERDGDCYAWLSELGAYSPIIHLQQTDGFSSAHLPFTAERNAWGIIDGSLVLRALKTSYDKPAKSSMPARCEEIYLTLELFTSTAAIMHDFMPLVRESAAYWRRWIPRDGMYLNELVDLLQ
ncbi:AP endonuclease [Spirochaetia bacterium]|nr:AP endonuclease [Spirochaetia bacterium]